MTKTKEQIQDVGMVNRYPGKDGYEKIILAQGTEHEIEINYCKPSNLNDGNARLFRALIEEIENLKKQLVKDEKDGAEMIYPDIPVEVWAKRWNISLKEGECLKCKKKFPFTKPFAAGKFRGVSQEVHECGEEYKQYLAITTDKEWNDLLHRVLESLKEREVRK